MTVFPPPPSGRLRPVASPRGRLLLLAMLPVLLSLAGCAGLGLSVSSEGRQRCERQAVAGSGGLAAPLQGWLARRRCLGAIEAVLKGERAEQVRQRQRRLDEAVRRCLADRQRLLSDLAQLRQEELELSLLRPELYVPAKAPPVYDEAMESRYTQADRDLDRQRYDKELAAWTDREVPRRLAWEAEHGARLAQAQARLDRLAGSLRARHPDLFITATGIEVREPVLERLKRCQRQELEADQPLSPARPLPPAILRWRIISAP